MSNRALPGPVHYHVLLCVRVDSATTQLTADAHASAVIDSLRGAIGRGLLTGHEPEAIIDTYSISVMRLDRARALEPLAYRRDSIRMRV